MAEKSPEPSPIETEAWQIAFAPYAEDAGAAYDMARRLMEVKRYLKTKPPNVISNGSAGRSLRDSVSLHRVSQGCI